MFIEFVGLTLLLALAPSTEAFADSTPRPLPISAHNCYAENRTDNPRLTEALALGIDNIEIDLGWDDAAGQLIVGHDATPRPAVAYPRLETSLIPALESHFKAPRPDGAPSVLTIDWKTAQPEAVQQFKELLDTHADWFSSAPKAADSPMTTRRLTVCFSGSEAAKKAYDALIPSGGTYRAFRDRVISGRYEADVAAYMPWNTRKWLMRCGPYPPAPAHEPNPASFLRKRTRTWGKTQGSTHVYRAENDSSRSCPSILTRILPSTPPGKLLAAETKRLGVVASASSVTVFNSAVFERRPSTMKTTSVGGGVIGVEPLFWKKTATIFVARCFAFTAREESAASVLIATKPAFCSKRTMAPPTGEGLTVST